ncbi:zinc finger protein 569-like [Spodoptera litura]|uniref:Zinc finger protein 569-like n=1 Tax=Spodoptera litura TaxID=69820 RepID=A0A9J7IZ57_SPOLT|nr:zinc finger protein 569-like [Spodoptera litura]
MDNYKLKINNILHDTQYCGICFENDTMSINAIDEDFEIKVNQQTEIKSLRTFIETVFRETEVEAISTASFICNNCTEKLVEAYIFIENAKETFKIISKYINDLFNKSNDILSHISDFHNESTNIVIVLENNTDNAIQEKEINSTTKKDEVEIKEVIAPETICSKFKCANCFLVLPSFKSLKLHKEECGKQTSCKQCSKIFQNKKLLVAHNEMHSKIRCKFCHEILQVNQLMDHLSANHRESLHKCLTCNEVFYTTRTLQSHQQSCEFDKENQCLMCLRTFDEEELSSHTCKFRCTECSEVPCIHYKYLVSFREQILKNTGNVKCLHCGYVCRKKETLLGHVNREHLNHNPFICDQCGQQFHSKMALISHIQRLHEEYFVCRFCDLEFSNQGIYKAHVQSCESTKRGFACDTCPASFDLFESVSEHKKRRHGTEVFPCNICNKQFVRESKRNEHMVKVHSNLQNELNNIDCVVCQRKFYSKGELVRHMKSHGPNTMYPCRICNTEYDTLRQFRAHNRIHKGPFTTCHICGKEMREILLKKHLRTHSDTIETCDTCGRSFENITLLKYHQRVHLESVPCLKCKKMVNPASLRRHWKRHLIQENPSLRRIEKKQPNLKCEQCDYKTWNNTLLDCHMNRHHLKVKPYVCHICSKDFIGKHLLKKHIETHDMKSVTCMVCLKSFANSICLKMHLRLHTGEKPFTCEICGDRFRSSSIMNVHKLKKHSDKNNFCPLCSNKFHTVRELRRHVIKVHWKQKNKRFDPREVEGLNKEHYHLFHDGRRVKVAEEDIDFYMPC